MKITRPLVLVALLVILVLTVTLPAVADPALQTHTDLPSGVVEDGPGPQWVPSGAKPGFYAARDSRNLPADTHALVGSHQSFYWDQLEPSEGVYRWDLVEGFLNRAVEVGHKQGALGIITFNGRRNEGNDVDPPLRTPAWVFDAGAQKVQCQGRGSQYPEGDPRHEDPPPFEIPAYWDPIYLEKYENFIAAFAQAFDGDPRIEFIQIGVGKYGETQPCDDNGTPEDYLTDDDCVLAAWQSVDPTATQWTWGDVTVKQITAIYADNFESTRLVLPNAPTFFSERGGRKKWTDDAIEKGVGLFPAGLMAIQEGVDYRSKPTQVGYGIFDRILEHVEAFEAGAGPEEWVNGSGREIAVAQEAYYYMTKTPIEYYWAILGALRRRVDYVTVEYDVLYAGVNNPRPDFDQYVEIMRWASQYMGKPLVESPSVWVALREAGYVDSWLPQKGNYTWGLYQVEDDEGTPIPGAKTVVATYRSKSQMVSDLDYADYGDAIVRASIETDQAFLGDSREGWICRRTDVSTGNPYMAFRIDDRYAYEGPYRATIRVTYLDRGYDSWDLLYDAKDNANKVAGTVQKTDTGAWMTATFEVSDAVFTNRQAGDTDLRIYAGSGDEYIHMVDVRVEELPTVYIPVLFR